MQEDPYNLPILTSDAASLLRRRVQKNDRPYISDTIKLNNRRVDDWKKIVLDEIADHRGTVPSGRVWNSWKLFDEGKSILQYVKLRDEGLIPEISDEVLQFWKDFFEKLTVEELHEYGTGTISFGWMIIQNYIKMWYANKKYENLFSESDDPLYWEKNYHSQSQLINGEILPFWDEELLKDIQHKVHAILMNQVEPQSQMGFR